HDARLRWLESDLSGCDPGGYPLAEADQAVLADPVTADVGVVCLLLRLVAFHDLYLARQVLQPTRDGKGRCQASLYHCGIYCLRAAHSFGDYFHQWVDSAVGR